jgi:hypothetical protein
MNNKIAEFRNMSTKNDIDLNLQLCLKSRLN